MPERGAVYYDDGKRCEWVQVRCQLKGCDHLMWVVRDDDDPPGVPALVPVG